MKKTRIPPFVVLAAVALSACAGTKIAVPPRIDLGQYHVVGLVQFSCNEEGTLDKYVTDEFLEYILSDQQGVRVIEMGSTADLLAEVGMEHMGPEAVIALAEKYRLAAIFLGELEVTDVKPKVNISSILSSMSVRAVVEARLKARLLERETGATIWTASSEGSHTVGEVHAFGDGQFHFDAEDPEKSYGALVEDLVDAVTMDFRTTWQRVKK